jgi:hypothetical protein
VKIFVTCAVCSRDFAAAAERGEAVESPQPFLPGEMRESGAVFATCPKGHESAAVYNHHKYDVLFQSGIAALEDGYANEAVSSFSAALERAYEFFIRVVCRKRGLTEDQIEAAWKFIAKQSERQFGAFTTLYLLETNQPFPLPDWVPAFRNKVIHQGAIPPVAEVSRFAGEVFTLIRVVIKHLQENAEFESSRELVREAQIQHRAIPPEIPRISMAQVGVNDSTYDSFEAWRAHFVDWRRFQGEYSARSEGT